MNVVIITPSRNKLKKFDAIVNGTTTISFGSRGMSDYTIHKDRERRERYILRHQKNERWDDPTTNGFYSRWLLWNLPSLQDSLKDMNKRFGSKGFHFFLRL